MVLWHIMVRAFASQSLRSGFGSQLLTKFSIKRALSRVGWQVLPSLHILGENEDTLNSWLAAA